ncbi:hypothetical protein QTJ16_004812 [Diplocarpon rosae]|uniref:Uncharacterized protein n=1 Tax=Diplocarpon rosae TaxID=946125 RepID=A0AAD9WBJ2_9HELO|nr:hypothetical protein QTJ16_004812 [Diplocarpon rosae]
MELPVGVNRRYASYAICILTTLWIWVALDRPYSFYYTAWSIYANAPQSPSRDLFDYPPLFSPAMRKLCGGTPWDESVVFMCSAPAGNVAEVRNEILSCVRYAMAAGGSLVIPRIAARALPRGVGAGNSTDLKHFFDTDHFVDSLRLSCPQMRLYKTAFSVQDGERARGPFTLQPETLLKPISGAGSQIPGQWKALFDQWLAESLESDAGGPVIIQLGHSPLTYPIASDGAALEHFGKILKIRADIRDLATSAILKFAETHAISCKVKDLMRKNVLLGAYLSTATDLDALPASDRLNARYDTQSRLYLDHAIRANLSVIYAASEHRADIPRLFKDAAALGIKVTSKLDLLRGRDRQSLLALTPDQQSLVDLLVLGLVSKWALAGGMYFVFIALRVVRHTSEEGGNVTPSYKELRTWAGLGIVAKIMLGPVGWRIVFAAIEGLGASEIFCTECARRSAEIGLGAGAGAGASDASGEPHGGFRTHRVVDG